MSQTFSELGLPFPLYDAPVESSDYVGAGSCCLCGTANTPCFRLGIGTTLIVRCPACGTENGIEMSDRAAVNCRTCHASIPFPAGVADRKEPKTCYSCLRAGKAALAKSTEFGLISWDQAVSGITGGVPGLRQDQFETVVLDADEDWSGVRVPQAMMFELLRTPTYSTWQGECWLFCCRSPMTFVGEWHREQFDQHAPDGNGESLFSSVVHNVSADAWNGLGDIVSVYVFECRQCGRLRSHSDSD